MREDVVDAPGVDVELRAEVAHRHRGALEVPAREPVAPSRRRPFQEAALAGAFPEREVRVVPLVRFDVAAMPGPQVVEGVAGQRAVARERRDRVVHVALGRGVGVPGVLERFGEPDHLRDVFGRAREDVGGQDVDQGSVGMERGLVGRRDLLGRLALEPGLDEHRIVAVVEVFVAQVADVRDVLDVQDLEPVIERRRGG